MSLNQIELDLDLRITRMKERRSTGGVWISGSIDGYRFEGLVFEDHAEVADYELGQSRVSKLFVQRIKDRYVVFSWDRGLDVPPADDRVAALVDFLTEGLAGLAFPEA